MRPGTFYKNESPLLLLYGSPDLPGANLPAGRSGTTFAESMSIK